MSSSSVPSGHAWIPGVVPAGARRFRVSDPLLAASLRASGAMLVEDAPDVDLAADPGSIRGDAPVALVTVAPRAWTTQRRPLRAGLRLLGSLETRVEAAGVRRALRRLGYEEVSVVLWDIARRSKLPGMPMPYPSLADRLPERAVVVARHGPGGPTALEAALAAAAREVGRELRPAWASVRAGMLILVATEADLLRAAIGGGSVQIANHADALQALDTAEPPALVAERIPRLHAKGTTGLVDWSLERLLPGEQPPQTLPPGLLEECLEFLVELHRAPGGGAGGPGLEELAETTAAVCRPQSARSIRQLGERLAHELSGIRLGFAHGDFFAGNLLSEGFRLTGVLDWDAGGPGRLPLVDLLHLELTQVGHGADRDWGRAVVERLLPLARAGGDGPIRRYCAEIGLEADPRLLTALVGAYWLGYVAYQLDTHAHRRSQRDWIEGNVELPLAVFAREL